MISNRIILVISGIVLAYFAVFFGEGMGTFSGADGVMRFAPIAALTVAVIGGGTFLYQTVMRLSTRKARMEDILQTTSCIVLACYAFGALATPFASFGATPWSWHSMWAWMPVAGFIPTVIATKDIAIDIIATLKREKNRPRASVRAISTHTKTA